VVLAKAIIDVIEVIHVYKINGDNNTRIKIEV